MTMNPSRVLFLCTANSCRSVMAESWCNTLWAGRILAMSAGSKPGSLNPRMVRAMGEAGIVVSSPAYWSKGMPEVSGLEFDLVVTVCDSAREACPVLPGARRTIHRAFDDPPSLARNDTDEQRAMHHFRRVRDEIRGFVETLPELLAQSVDGHGANASN